MNIPKLSAYWFDQLYTYDQLNRIKSAVNYHTSTGGSPALGNDYSESFTYDGNGNIKTTNRSGTAAGGMMDQLQYHYNIDPATGKLKDNRLNYITDVASDGTYTTDLKTQDTLNYNYDKIGNLTKDTKSGVASVYWTVYGKIQELTGGSGRIIYKYDPAGERISKKLGPVTTYYVRDATGNTLAVYDDASSTSNWKEQHLYGSSRLGLWTPNVSLGTDTARSAWQTIGVKQYELNNHLGNVMTTITDRRLQYDHADTVVTSYAPDVATAQNYYAFGSLMPGRSYPANGTANYRYGFNGKENDNDVKGTGNEQDYGMRIYDPRVGRFLSVDPIGKNFPWYSPYQFAGNNPIQFVDVDGEEPKEKTANYGKSVLIGLINSGTLKNNAKMTNNNWLGVHSNLEEGLKYIESLKTNMLPTTQLMNFVFVTHGGHEKDEKKNITYHTEFHPDPKDMSYDISAGDIDKFMRTGTSGGLTENGFPKNTDPIFIKKDKGITELKAIFDLMGTGGTFVLAACNVGDDDDMGAALKRLSNNRINIYLSPDVVRVALYDGGEGKELDNGRIQDDKTKWLSIHYQEGFVLYKAGDHPPEYTDQNITLKSNGTPITQTDPTTRLPDRTPPPANPPPSDH